VGWAFGGRIHGRDVRCVTKKLTGPHPGTAGEFEHASSRPECPKCLRQLAAAWKIQALAGTIRGEGSVVSDLLIEELPVFFTTS
jgi:hypothetical protein